MCGITEPDSNGDCNSQVENGTASLLPQIDKKSRHPAIVADVIPVQVCKYACIYGQHAELHDWSQKDKKRALPSSRDVTIMMQSQCKGAHQGNPACVGGLLLTNEAGKGREKQEPQKPDAATAGPN
jgi:hypothetical protein